MSKQAVNEMLFTSPDGDKLLPASEVTNHPDGSYSFEVANHDNTVRFRHTIKTEEV